MVRYHSLQSDTFENCLYTFTGLKYCKINIHLLCHLSHYVRLFGPLWTHSAFSFEDCIGHLVKKCHGTHDIANQDHPMLLAIYVCYGLCYKYKSI